MLYAVTKWSKLSGLVNVNLIQLATTPKWGQQSSDNINSLIYNEYWVFGSWRINK